MDGLNDGLMGGQKDGWLNRWIVERKGRWKDR